MARVNRWRRGIFYGWWMVLIGAILNAISSGFYGTGFTVYFLPLSRDLGFSRTATSIVFGAERLEGGIWGLAAGAMIDRWGPRLLMLIGPILAGAGFILLALTHNYISFLLVYLGLLSFGMHVGYNQGVMVILNNWFAKHRGMAFSMMAVGISVGGAAITPIIALVVLNQGWRTAAVVSGIAVLVISLPLAMLMRSTPEEMGLHPDGEKPNDPRPTETARAHAGPPIDGDPTVREALGTWSYWLLALAIALRIGVRSGVTVHLVPLMVWKGSPEKTAAVMVGIMAASSGVGRLFAAWIGDRWSRQRTIAFGMLAGTASLVILMLSGGHAWELALFLVVFGVVDAVASLSWAIIGDFYGRRSFGTLRGLISFILSLASMGFPIMTGWVYDNTQSYYGALVPLAALYVATGVLFWLIKPPKRKPRSLSHAEGTVG